MIFVSVWFVLAHICKFSYTSKTECNNPLGLESGEISDGNIIASSYLSSIKMPKHARLNKDFAWTAKNTDNQYIQFDLKKTKKIQYIATQGRQNQNEYVTIYQISYSIDAIDWILYKDVQGNPKNFKGNYDSNSIFTNELIPPIIARYIRILPIQWNLYISLRAEIYGCEYHSNVVSFRGRGEMIRHNLIHDQMHTSQDIITFRFLTSHKSGIIMHSIGSQGDVISLQLKDARLYFYIVLGGYEQSGNVLTVGNLLDDNHWHDVLIERRGKYVTLMVDQMNTTVMLKDDFEKLDLDTYLTFGGMYLSTMPFLTTSSSLSAHFRDLTSTSTSNKFPGSNWDDDPPSYTFFGERFIGCLDNVVVNGINVIYETRKKARGFDAINNPLFDCKVKKSPILTFTLPETHFEWEALEGLSALNVSLQFRTFHGQGLIIHHVLNSGGSLVGGGGGGGFIPSPHSYISLLLKDGKIVADINVPRLWDSYTAASSQSTNLLHNNIPNIVYDESTYKHIINPFDMKWNDGLWHQVNLHVKTNEIHLNIDEYTGITKRKIDIKTGQKYLIAGGSNPDEYPGYLGCLRSLYLDSRMIPIASLKTSDFRSNSQGVTLNSCSLVDRCTPNPCLNEGTCSQDWNNFECHCQGTGYSGAVCHKPLHPPSCEAYKQRKHLYTSSSKDNIVASLSPDGHPSWTYNTGGNSGSHSGTPLTIDIDGSGPSKPFRVICEFDNSEKDHVDDQNYGSKTKTILGHNMQWDRNPLPDAILDTTGEENAITRQAISYVGLGNNYNLLELFVNRSTHCEQYVKYECLRARLMNSPNWNEPHVWLISRNNQPMYYWGGAPAGSGKCSCGVKGTCIDNDKFCNCDAFTNFYTEDSGYFSDKDSLPVTGITFNNIVLSENPKAHYTIGPLVCSGDVLFENVVTFRKAKAILTYPPMSITNTGDLQFEFKTSHLSGVIFENLGTDGTRNYIRMKLVDGKKIQLEFNSDDGHRTLSADSTDTLNDNKWHLVTFDWNDKEIQLTIDSYRPATMLETEANFRTLTTNKLTRKLVIGARSDMTDGYVGCIRVFMINGNPIDLITKVRNINKLLNGEISIEDDYDDRLSNPLSDQPYLNKRYNRKNIGIIEGCHGVCDKQTDFPCKNNGTCYEMWSHAKCDCAWTAFRGPFCTEDVGAHLKSDSLITYRFPSNLGSLTTISEHLRIAFSTLEFQGILLEITSYSGDFISLQLQNNGGLKIRFNFGYEPQEINDDRQVYANGQFHEVNLWRRDSGSTIVLQVDNYEPLTKRYETGFSQDTKFNDLRAIYIGRNETTPMGKGFVGCISRVEFEDYFPLKEVFGDPRPPHVSVTNKDDRELVEDMCNVIPENPIQSTTDDVFDEILLKAENIQKVFNGFARRTPRYIGVKVALIIASLIFITIIGLFLAFVWAKYYTRQKGDYLTHEDAGAKDSIDADTAIMKSPIGQLDTIKKEWFF